MPLLINEASRRSEFQQVRGSLGKERPQLQQEFLSLTHHEPDLTVLHVMGKCQDQGQLGSPCGPCPDLPTCQGLPFPWLAFSPIPCSHGGYFYNYRYFPLSMHQLQAITVKTGYWLRVWAVESGQVPGVVPGMQ